MELVDHLVDRAGDEDLRGQVLVRQRLVRYGRLVLEQRAASGELRFTLQVAEVVRERVAGIAREATQRRVVFGDEDALRNAPVLAACLAAGALAALDVL